MTLFVKQYANSDRAAKARDNYIWLASLNSAVLLPNLVTAHGNVLAFAELDGAMPGPGDLVTLAAVIGRMHHAAAPALAAARLDRQHAVGEVVINDFTESRRATLHHAAATCGISPQWIDGLLDGAANMQPAFYKDSNLRNFILTRHGVAVVDFDDLTLAPQGYDLAKLVASIGMTFGRITMLDVSAALDAYNTAVGCDACTARDLAIWTELNWLLTANYMGRNGYEHPWPQVRPWVNPFQEGSQWLSPPN